MYSMGSCHRLVRVHLTQLGAAFVLFSSALVHAQVDRLQEIQTDEPVEEVIVTGSRILRSGYDTPTPVSQLGSEEMNTQAPVNIATVVNQLPALAGSGTSTTSIPAMGGGVAGISSLNLRALGADRTLVLLDGRRSAVSASAGLVDTNTMPQGLIERVEVVTGGASAAYGSGAIGGVVNFILDNDFTGVETSLAYGETTYGDNDNWKVNFTAGTPFSNDKGHLLLNAEMVNVDGIHPPTPNRPWNSHGHFAMPNPDQSPGAPAYIVDNNIGLASHTPGGLIISGPLKGTYFGLNGTVNQFAYGDVGGQLMRGGDTAITSQAGNMSLQAAEERQSVFLKGSYDLTPDLAVFGEASYAHFEGFANYIRVETLRIPVQRDNAFLPAEVASAMDEAGIDSFLMSTTNGDAGISGNNFSRETQRYLVGANGLFTTFGSNVEWDFYYQKSITDANHLYLPTIYHLERMAMATDAVVDSASGQIVCRSTLSDPQNGCVPLNRFGVGVSSREAWDYVSGAPERDERYELDVVSINFRPGRLPGWSDPIQVAVGAEWRKEEIFGEVEEQYMEGWRFSNFKEDRGHYDVLEGYVETLVPIGYGFDFNGAVRLSDYSTTGRVTSWKAGLTFSPVDDVTVRLTKSRDIRSPNLGELFATGTGRGNSVSIDGVTVQYQQSLQGTTNLDSEMATSWNIGLVMQPSYLPGFGASIDYYDIEVRGVIDSLSAEEVTSFCFDSNVQEYCNNMHFTDPSDPLTLHTVDIFFENLNSLSAKGIDIEASYQVGLADIFDGGDGYLNFRAMATHYIDNIVDNRVTAIDQAGSNEGPTPDWKYRLLATYTLEPWTFNVTARGVSDGVISNSYIECSSNCPPSSFPNYTINNNHIDGATFFDAYAARRFNVGDAEGELFLSVSNVFNTDPPLTAEPADAGSASQPSFPQTNQSLYDYLGRTWRFGVRMGWGGG